MIIIIVIITIVMIIIIFIYTCVCLCMFQPSSSADPAPAWSPNIWVPRPTVWQHPGASLRRPRPRFALGLAEKVN